MRSSDSLPRRRSIVLPSPKTRRPSRRPLSLENLEPRQAPAVILWDGGPTGSGTNWNDPVNWAGDALPGAADDAQISSTFAGMPITASDNVTIRSLTTAAPLEITAGTFALGGATSQIDAGLLVSGGTLRLSATTLTGGGTLTNLAAVNIIASTVNTQIVNQGTLLAQGVSAINGSLDTSPGSMLRALGFPTTGLSLLTVAQGFTNRGMIELSGDGGFGTQFTISNGTLTNEVGATFRTLTSSGVTHIFVGQFDNQGAMLVQGGQLILNKPTATYVNRGTLSVRTGNLHITQSGAGASFANSGNISIDSGRTFDIRFGAFNHDAGTISGGGTMTLTQVVTGFESDFSNGLELLKFDRSPVTSPGTLTNLPGRTLQFIGEVVNANLVNQGTLLASGNFNGAFSNEPGATLRLGGMTLASGFTNHGTIEMTGPQNFSTLLEVTSGTLVNAVDGTIRVLPSGDHFLKAQLDNRGTLEATLGIQTRLFLDKPSAAHTNSGTIRFTGGSFLVGQSGNQSLTNTGVMDVGGNGSLTIASGVGITNNESGILAGHPTGMVGLSGPFAGATNNASRFAPQPALQFNGPGTPANPQLLEVMGEDRGNTTAGYTDNFVISKLALAPNSFVFVRLVNSADNAVGTGPEALYVDQLVVPSGTTLDLNSFNVYARQMQIQGTVLGGTVMQAPDGGHVSLNSTSAGTIAIAGEVDEWTFFGRAGQSVTAIVNPGTTVIPAPLPPALNQVDVRLLDPAGGVFASAATITPGAPVALPNIELPTEGTYRIQVRASAGDGQGNYMLTLASANIDTMPLHFNQRKNSILESEYSVDRWVFTAQANQHVQLDWINAAPATIQFRLTGPNGFVGFTGLTGDSNVVTLPESGTYTLEVTTGGNQGGNYAFELESTSTTFLLPGIPYNGALVGSGQSQLFAVDVPGGQQLSVILDDDADGNRNELYAKFGAPPTRADYQFRAVTSSADQTINIPNAAPGTWYFLLYSDRVVVQDVFTMTARSDEILLSHVTPDRHGNGTEMVLMLSGAGFDHSTIVELVDGGGAAFSANVVEIDSPTQLTATFAAGSVPLGNYTVRVLQVGGGSATLANAFEVQPGSEGRLETKLILPDSVGRHQPATIYVEYANTGNAAIPAPLLVLRATDRALLTLEETSFVAGFWTWAVPPGFGDTVQILGWGATPGLLQPGEHFRIPVYFAGLELPWDLSDNSVDFNLNTISSDTTEAIDWESMEDLLRPPGISTEAWAPIYANLTAQIGTTWGDYVSMLSDNARYLGHIGQSVKDVNKLWSFEVQQAIGFSPTPNLAVVTDMQVDAPGIPIAFTRVFSTSTVGRYEQGPLGRGWAWATGWQRRIFSEADGTVVVSGIDGRQRRFLPDLRFLGRYFSEPGDDATLTGLAGGTFQLRESDGLITRFRGDGRVDFVADPNGNRITATWAGMQLTRLTHSAGQFLQIQYDNGRVASLVDQAGRTVVYSYDATGEHLQTVTGIDGQTTGYTYSIGAGAAREHALVSIEYPDQTHEFFTYDSQGRLDSMARDNNAERVAFFYDSAGRVTATDALNGSTKYFFNHQGMVGATVDALGRRTLFDYDHEFNLTHVIDALGQNYLYGYDDRGNVTRSTDPLGQITTFQYTADFDRLESMRDPLGNSLNYSYDNRGNLTVTRYADGSVERIMTDARGELDSWTNRRGQLVDYVVNADGRLERRELPDGSFAEYHYNTRGNLDLATDATGSIALEYLDPQNPDLPTKITYPNGRFLQYAYQNGRRMQMVDQDGFTTHYRYDAVGRLEFLRDGSGNLIVQYHYDDAGRLLREDKGNGTFTEYQYDVAGQLGHVINKAPSGAVNSRFDYGYDRLGRRTSMATLDGVWNYTYDAIGQLTAAEFDSNNPGVIPHQDLHYEYDAAGNRTRTIINGVITDYVTNNLNQYEQIGTTDLAYDLDGNLISRTDGGITATYAFNALNRLTAVSESASAWTYRYDAFDNRSATTHNGQPTEFLIDPFGLGNVVAEHGTGGNLVAHYVHGFGLAARVDASAMAAYYSFDGNGNTAQLTGAGGTVLNAYRYLPFGEASGAAETIANPFTFVGQFGVMREGHGLYLMRQRFYDARDGHFTAPDPIGPSGGDANLHRYVSNDPVNFIDPSGLAPAAPLAVDGGPMRRPDVPERPRGPAPPKLEDLRWIPMRDCEVLGGLPVRHDSGNSTRFCLLNLTHEECDNTGGGFIRRQRIAVCFLPIEPDTPPPSPPPGAGPGGQTDTVASGDPNEKTGPAGFGSAHFIAAGSAVPYRIDFENDATATAPAQRVVITDQLDTNLDWDTFGWTEVGFGDVLITIPPGNHYFQGTVPMSYNGRSFQVEFELSLDSSTGQLTAAFQSIDPATFLPPDVLTGMLPPEDGTGRGQGHISYTVQPHSDLPTGTEIRNIALITFDVNDVIATNQIDPHDPSQGTSPDREALVTIDAGNPTSSVSALPPTSQTRINVRWSGTDDAGGAGVATFDVFVSIDGAPPVIWLDDTRERFAQYLGEIGHTYSFSSVATDNVGNHEEPPPIPDAMTFVNAGAGDFNADGVFDCGDINQLVAAVASGSADPSFDLTGDQLVTVADVTDWLALAGAANLTSGNPYLSGDANLDGVVDGSDFNVWNSNKFTTVAAWCSGDFNADGVVDGSDFNVWNSNKFQLADSGLGRHPEALPSRKKPAYVATNGMVSAGVDSPVGTKAVAQVALYSARAAYDCLPAFQYWISPLSRNRLERPLRQSNDEIDDYFAAAWNETCLAS